MSSLRHLTLIADNGIMLYHTSFLQSDLDEILLSGFTGAITAIARELKDEIVSIHMERQTFYLHHFDNLIIILSTIPEINDELVFDRLHTLENSESLRTMANDVSLEILIEANNELHMEIADLFEIEIEDETIEFDDEFEGDEEELFQEVLRELDSMV